MTNLRHLFLQGGSGSGNFDHKGRPGEVGGSQPENLHPSNLNSSLLHRIDVLANYLVDKLQRFPNKEHGYVIDKDGNILETRVGKSVAGHYEIPLTAKSGEITIHSHPLSSAPSMMDIKNAAADNLLATVVVTKDGTYIVEPGPDGWRGTESIQQYDPHSLTQKIADEHGLIYTQRPLKPGMWE